MRVFHYFVIIIIITTSLNAQPDDFRNRELSFSGSYQNISSGSGPENAGALLLSSRLGFFIYKGLELEPELLFLIASGSDPVYMLNCNVSYNFITEGKAIPFLLIGYGLANTVPYLGIPILRSDFRIGVLNLGFGLKTFIKEDIAIRAEYRFQKYHGEKETGTYYNSSYYQKVDTRIHSVQFGLSLLF